MTEQKRRVIVNIRTLNATFLSNFHSLWLQNEIILIVNEYTYISIIDCANFFYQ